MALRGLLALLRQHPHLVESDLSQFHHIDYRDRWRRDQDGVRRLTLRMIYVRVVLLPPTSALSLHFSNGCSVWDLHAHILADLVRAWTGAEYPNRPGGEPEPDPAVTAERERKRTESRKRAQSHNNQPLNPNPTIAEAVEVARANARAEQEARGER